MHFTGDIIVRQYRDYWILQDPIVLCIDGREFCVPEGFVTDFASFPRLLWNIFPPSDDQWSKAAIVHDRLYETHEVSRRYADDIFYRSMALLGSGRFVRCLIWLGVRLGGAWSYRTGAQRQIERFNEWLLYKVNHKT